MSLRVLGLPDLAGVWFEEKLLVSVVMAGLGHHRLLEDVRNERREVLLLCGHTWDGEENGKKTDAQLRLEDPASVARPLCR